MKYLVPIGALILLACSPVVHAKTVFLQCKVLSRPSHSVAYSRLPEEERGQMIRESFKHGIVQYLIEPSNSWVIDLVTGHVHAPDNPEEEVIGKASISVGSVRGDTKNYSQFTLNRVTGMLEIKKVLVKVGPIKLNGIPIETVSTWKYLCAARAPAI